MTAVCKAEQLHSAGYSTKRVQGKTKQQLATADRMFQKRCRWLERLRLYATRFYQSARSLRTVCTCSRQATSVCTQHRTLDMSLQLGRAVTELKEREKQQSLSW